MGPFALQDEDDRPLAPLGSVRDPVGDALDDVREVAARPELDGRAGELGEAIHSVGQVAADRVRAPDLLVTGRMDERVLRVGFGDRIDVPPPPRGGPPGEDGVDFAEGAMLVGALLVRRPRGPELGRAALRRGEAGRREQKKGDERGRANDLRHVRPQ